MMKHISLGAEISADPATRLIVSVLEQAVAEQASYIHLEPREDELRVRMRIEGQLKSVLTVPRDLRLAVISRLKEMASMDLAEFKKPQNGRVTVTKGEIVTDLRIATLPCIFGEKMVVQLSKKESGLLDRRAIGLYGEDLEKYACLMRSQSGLILVAGPAGAGKTTTLYTMITDRCNERIDLVTLEDPVEYDVPSCNQVQIDESSGMTYVNGLSSILRQDPDIIALGEIRDAQAARMAMQAALAGRLVLSTIFAENALSVIGRLLDMGLESYLISGSLKGVVSQRLVRRICPQCKESYRPTPDDLAAFDLPPNDQVRFYRGSGCAACKGTGYRGRIGVFEILVADPTLQEGIRKRVGRRELQDILARNGNFVPLAKSVRRMVLNGTTTMEEALRAFSPSETCE